MQTQTLIDNRAPAEVNGEMHETQQSADSVLVVENVSKRYEIYERPQDRLKQSIIPRLQSALPASWRRSRPYYTEFWALRGVSFQLSRGEALGILGRNGAGKSTLLQIIAGTLNPTSGNAMVRGKVAALLELGSGFSPDFTGEENVRLNAALLGLNDETINRKFDSIVSFADIGDFIGQPVKTYSSGMMLRLAFAVQTAVEPDLLIIDEALAVGDARFQKKCFSRLDQLRKTGTTILFVSHDTSAVVQFCSRAMILDGGMTYMIGPPQSIARKYHRLLFAGSESAELAPPSDGNGGESGESSSFLESSGKDDHCEVIGTSLRGDAAETPQSREVRYGTREAEIVEIGIRDDAGCETRVVDVHSSCEFHFKVRLNRDIRNAVAYGVMISNARGLEIFATSTGMQGEAIPPSAAGSIFVCSFSARLPITPGVYFLSVSIAHGDGRPSTEFLDYRFDALQFQVVGFARSFTTSIVDIEGALSHAKIQDGFAHRLTRSTDPA